MTRRDLSVTPIYLKDEEIAARVGMSTGEWGATALVLEKHGLPKRDPLFHNRRCWPAVEAFLIERARPSGARMSGEPEEYRGFSKRRARTGQYPQDRDGGS